MKSFLLITPPFQIQGQRHMQKSSKVIIFEDSMKVAWSDPKKAKSVEGRGSFYFHIAQTHTGNVLAKANTISSLTQLLHLLANLEKKMSKGDYT